MFQIFDNIIINLKNNYKIITYNGYNETGQLSIVILSPFLYR